MLFAIILRFKMFTLRYMTKTIISSFSGAIRTPLYRLLATNPEKFKISYNFGHGDSVLIGSTIGQALNKVSDKIGNQLAFVFCHQDIRRTFLEINQETDQLAASFLELGLRPGERLAIWSTNCYEWVLTQLAAAKAGLVLVNINPAFMPSELEYCFNLTSCKALIAGESFRKQDYFQQLCSVVPEIISSKPGQIKSSRCPDLHTVVMLTKKDFPGVYKFDDILSAAGNEKLRQVKELDSKIQFDDPVNIQFTSGTTGKPKPATLSHFNVINNAVVFTNILIIPGVKPVDCVPIPLFHSFGYVGSVIATIIHQKVSVFPSSFFNPVATLKAIETERMNWIPVSSTISTTVHIFLLGHQILSYKCTLVMGTPTMFVDIVNHPDVQKFDLTTLQGVLIGASPCPVQLWKDIEQKLGVTNLINAYGTTENSPGICSTRPDERLDKKYHTVGTPLDHVEVKIVDNDGRIVPVNKEGELCTRGHITFLGYWGDKEQTGQVLDDARWYHTGDTAVMDEDGYISIVGRIKDMIIRGGENIYPREIEEFLHGHPDVAEVQVVGVPDQRMGEEVCAWVKLKGGSTVTETELREYCHGKISNFKIPRYIVLVEDFPKTSTGKIMKYKIKETMREKLECMK
ncbi:medium-chain acyl-CoA ligase ACSF2, mitochondrial-like isoform X2 [Tachypleus tridentatus]|uniref:medium-chain acyl-CoA ligase ACSF2, mitochondrial-like isoform X2 n=1 Tax=Tachypleus tridentatus TaxID=6853 RepID=UPI003FD53374